MGIVPQAAFNPVFWLHHAMVDNIFASWQEVRPNELLEQWAEVGATMTYASGAVQSGSSSLTPFHESAGKYWTSDAVRHTQTFNYRYADLASGQGAASIINSLYRDSEPEMTVRKRALDLDIRGLNVSQYINDVMNPKPGSTCREYVANIQVDSMKMAGSFTVFLFTGPFDEKPGRVVRGEEHDRRARLLLRPRVYRPWLRARQRWRHDHGLPIAE